MNKEYIIAMAEQISILRKALLDNEMEYEIATQICIAYMGLCIDYAAKGL